MKARRLHNWILMADLLWAGIALVVAAVLRYGLHWGEAERFAAQTLIPFLISAWVIWGLLSHVMQLDGFRRGWRFSAIVAHLSVAVAFLMILLLAGAYLSQRYVSRLALSYFGVLLFLGFLKLRWIAFGWLRRRYRRGDVSRIVILGSGPVASELALKLDRHPEMLCKVVGFLYSEVQTVGSDSCVRSNALVSGISTLGVTDLLHQQRVNELILALPRPAMPEVLNLVARCRKQGIGVSLIPQPYELYLSKPNLIDLDGLPLLQLRDASTSNMYYQWKRVVDVCGSSVLTLLAIPVLLPIIIALRLTKGQAFRWEKRCGWQGREFSMLRLNVDRDPQGDTPIERILWQLSLTEVPQLWNVLRGDMSLVGPRPESLDRARRYSDWQRQRLSVRPGMTGLAQVHGLREQHSTEEKARFDLQYLLHPSPMADLSLVLQTLWTLITRLVCYLHLAKSHEGYVSPEGGSPLSGDEVALESLQNAHRAQSSAN
jgi:lipopolysaccharide/colanic/teichoic acid biosynthesis glycosyltransferase